MDIIEAVKRRWEDANGRLDERQRRSVLGAEARALGWGGIKAVSAATGVGLATVARGARELSEPLESAPPTGRSRRAGGGRRKLRETDAGLVQDLSRLVDSSTRGDPESPLCWTTKSLRHLSRELSDLGHSVSHVTVRTMLKAAGYSLQGNVKVLDGISHPDRNAQFEFISNTVKVAIESGQPAISVDTKKKELVGQFKSVGREWEKSGEPIEVNSHDFLDPDLGKVNPYGVYDLGANDGFVSVGTDNDTSAFAVEAIRRWWFRYGQPRYPDATELVVTADCGGSNGYRGRLWKQELANLATETGLTIRVSHFPPGTSKWNKIEHRMFSAITLNWRGRPLVSHEVIISMIAGTHNKSGLTIRAEMDKTEYPRGIVVTKAEIAALPIVGDDFHGEWNYVIRPSEKM